MPEFELHSPFQPTGDQPNAITGLVKGLERGDQYDIGVSLRAGLLALERRDDVVKIQCRDHTHRKSTIEGILISGEFYGESGTGRFRVHSSKVTRILVNPPPETRRK